MLNGTFEDRHLHSSGREGIPTHSIGSLVLDGVVLKLEVYEHQRSTKCGLLLHNSNEVPAAVKSGQWRHTPSRCQVFQILSVPFHDWMVIGPILVIHCYKVYIQERAGGNCMWLTVICRSLYIQFDVQSSYGIRTMTVQTLFSNKGHENFKAFFTLSATIKFSALGPSVIAFF
jgi:hypothetical protein